MFGMCTGLGGLQEHDVLAKFHENPFTTRHDALMTKETRVNTEELLLRILKMLRA
jgi:hypothetical protein